MPRKSRRVLEREWLERQQARIYSVPARVSLLWGWISIPNRFTCDRCLDYVELEGSWVIPNQYPRNSSSGLEWEVCLLCCPTREAAIGLHRNLLEKTQKCDIRKSLR